MPLVERMTIAGVGLIGGSLALAAKRAGLVGEVIGIGRTAANLAVAQKRGIVDRIAAEPKEAGDVDLIVLAAPVGSCAALADRLGPHARAGTVVTDVGSVKAMLVDTLEAVWPEPARVVGAHPIAGSEESGAGAARADLFEGRLCILTPTERTGLPARGLVRTLWEGVGARVEEMSPKVHDAILARVSHLPHVVAYALLRALGARREGERNVLDYAGQGFLDSTRIAASPPEIWRDIALANRDALRAALNEFRAALEDLSTLIDANDDLGLQRALAAAADARRALGDKR
jgi:prephenate dehydrogenase